MEFFNLLFRLIFWFMLYSVVGWIYESVLCSITDRHLVNRGFLNGPYCPIYGSGALLDIFILGRIENPFLLFFLGVIVTCTLEYLTSYVMEKLFKARWWDYSDKKFNIGGRVCLLGAVAFGLFSVILIKVLHPAVCRLTDMLPTLALNIISAVFAVGFITDLIVTVAGFSDFNRRLESLAQSLGELKTEATDKLRSSAAFSALNSAYESFAEKLSAQQRRMLAAFPKLSLKNHNHLLSEIRERFLSRRRFGKKK